jgi:hypothetical protein
MSYMYQLYNVVETQPEKFSLFFFLYTILFLLIIIHCLTHNTTVQVKSIPLLQIFCMRSTDPQYLSLYITTRDETRVFEKRRLKNFLNSECEHHIL